MDKKTIVENGWMTDVAVACDNSVTMDSDLFKACVTSADVHELVWPDEESNGEDNGEAQAASIEDPVTPVVEETPEEETPVEDETPVVEETPAEDETPEEETPVVDPEDEE
jgi:hypothetical protein